MILIGGCRTVAKEIQNLVVNCIHDRELRGLAERCLRGRLIDVGCRDKPCKQILSPYISQHIGADHHETLHEKKHVNLWGTVYHLPSEDQSFDYALCTALLEHLEEPEIALRECHRVLLD